MPLWNQLLLHDAGNYILYRLDNLHILLLSITIRFSLLLTHCYLDLLATVRPVFKIESAPFMELTWTMTPVVVLIIIVVPSLKLLYLMDDSESSDLGLTAIGHQWYWEYSYPNFEGLQFDSYMTSLLDVDNRISIPCDRRVRLIVGSTDVLHAWALPSLGVKVDATPGRINQILIKSFFPTIIVGQCSEICGANHSFIPIVVEVSPLTNFCLWVRV